MDVQPVEFSGIPDSSVERRNSAFKRAKIDQHHFHYNMALWAVSHVEIYLDL